MSSEYPGQSAARDEVGLLLADLQAGRPGAEDALLPLVYEELRALARRQMRGERSDHTLQTTALVHEAYLRLQPDRDAGWQNKAHFMRIAARAMRRVLIDHARRRNADRRGGGMGREPLEAVAGLMEGVSTDLLSVDAALSELASFDARVAQVVELRFFGGLTIEETAKVMGISAGTVKNEWTIAKAWLKKRLT